MAQTMELSLDVQSPIQTLQQKRLKRHHAILCPGWRTAIAIIPTTWSRNTLQEQKPKTETGKKVIDKNFLPFPSWRNHYWHD